MSEFVQVMNDWRRMCRAMDKEFGSESCAHCPLDGCSAVYDEMDDSEDYTENERQIEAWAAEHPEPVYPSWYAWLANMGIVPIELPPDQAIFATDIGLLKKIPADIAEKLGIEPIK